MKRALFSVAVFLLAMAGAVELCALPAWGQQAPPRRGEGYREGPRRRMDGPARRRQERNELMQFRILDRLSKMDPEERRKVLSKLPPPRRRWAEANLKRFQEMPPQRRQALAERLRQFEQMTPERQTHLRGLMRSLGQLPKERRELLQSEFRKIKRMSAEDRLDYTSSETFTNRFPEDDRELLLDLVETAPDP